MNLSRFQDYSETTSTLNKLNYPDLFILLRHQEIGTWFTAKKLAKSAKLIDCMRQSKYLLPQCNHIFIIFHFNLSLSVNSSSFYPLITSINGNVWKKNNLNSYQTLSTPFLRQMFASLSTLGFIQSCGISILWMNERLGESPTTTNCDHFWTKKLFPCGTDVNIHYWLPHKK